MINIAIIQRRIPSFRIPLFNRINENSKLNLTVYYALKSDVDGAEFRTQKYRIKFIRFGKSIIAISINLLWPLLTQGYHVVVIEGSVSSIMYLIYIPLLKLRKIKICWWSCGFEPFGTIKLKRIIRDLLYGLISRLVDNVIVYSSRAGKYYQLLGKESSKVFAAINVLDTHALLGIEKSIQTLEKRRAISTYHLDKKKILLYVGKIEPQKKLIILLEAYRFLLASGWENKIALLVIGDGKDKNNCKSFADRNSLTGIHFLREIRNPREVSIYFKISDVFVMPGAGGLGIYHAMIHELPVVVSCADGTEEDLVLENETGIYFKLDDARDLAYKLNILLNKDENSLKEMGKKAQKRVLNEFPIDKMVDKFGEAILG